MKIIDNRNNTIFGELNPGVVFMYPEGKSVYMKTTESDSSDSFNSSNCVNLTNGHLGRISGDDFVIVVDATLILE